MMAIVVTVVLSCFRGSGEQRWNTTAKVVPPAVVGRVLRKAGSKNGER